MANLECAVDDNVATITLNRPGRKNAFTSEMVEKWAQALKRADTDCDVSVAVVTGAEGAFRSGVDLDEVTRARGRRRSRSQLPADRVNIGELDSC